MAQRIALAVYIACFAIGTVTHTRDFWALGMRPYQGAPIVLEAFWSSLVVLDLTTAGLLLIDQRRSGLALAVVTMVCDVAANSYAFFMLGINGFAIALPLQAAFLGYVLGSIRVPVARPELMRWRPHPATFPMTRNCSLCHGPRISGPSTGPRLHIGCGA